MGLFKKKNEMYLSDKQPLTKLGVMGLVLSYIILILWAFIIIWPISQIVITSFNGNLMNTVGATRIIIGADNYRFSLENFSILMNDTLYLKWVGNTLFIGIATALLTVLLVSFTGYVYSRFRFKGRKPTLMAIMLVQTIPAFAGITAYFVMYSIMSGILPAFTKQMMLILIYSAGGIAGNTFILKGYLDSISMELDDAGKIDGCSNMQVYRLIIMPIAKPMLAIIALWSFIGPFMDFFLPRVLLGDPKNFTLAAGVYTFVTDQNSASYNEVNFVTGALLSSVPIVLMFIFLQKYLVSGLSKGSVKG